MRNAAQFILTLFAGALFGLSAAAQRPSPLPLLERGIDLFERGHWTDARHELLRARALLGENHPHEAEQIDYYIAVCAVELGRPDAETALLNYERSYPGSFRTNDIRFARASLYCTSGEYSKARAVFDETDYRALSAGNRNKFDIRRGYLAFADGEYDEAYRYFSRVDVRSEYGEHALYYLSYIDYARGDYARAKRGFERLLNSDAYRSVAPFYLLQIEFRQRNYRYVTDRGEALLDTASPRQRHDLHRMMAEAWFHQEEWGKALACVEALRREGGTPERSDSYVEGFSLYRLTRYEAAAEALRRAAGPDDALTQNAAYHLADCCLRLGRKEEAMQAFAMATGREWNADIAEEALFNYGKLQYELGGGRFSEAIHVLGRYVQEYPRSERVEEAQTLLAAAYYNSEDYDAAYTAIKQLPAPDSDLRAALQKITYFRALKRYERGDMEGALGDLRESAAIGISPRYTSLATFWQGEIAFAREDYGAAERAFESFLARAPRTEREYALAYYNLGYCRFQRQQTERAREPFDKFLALYPLDDDFRTDALNRQGDIHFAARRFDRALGSYEEAIAAGRAGRHYARYQRALTLGILERPEQKIEALKAIVADNRGDYVADATYELGRTYLSQGRYKESAAALERFAAQYPHSPRYTAALSDLGLIYANLGDRKRSMEYYDRVVRTAPTSAEARNAMEGIRELYVAGGDVQGYFDYAERSGGGDLSARTRDSLSFAAARSLYADNRTEDAARSLRSYVKSFPQGVYLTDALYFLSDCYRRTKEPDREIGTLVELTGQGQNQYTVEALDRLARLAEAQKRYDVAAEAYRRLSGCAPTKEARGEAVEGYVETTLALKDDDAALKMAAAVTAHGDATPAALRRARFAEAKIRQKQGREAEALALYDQLRTEVRTAEGAEAMYRVIEARVRAGEREAAEKLIFDFAEMPSPRNYWLAKAYILLGDLYRDAGDSFQARATYQSIVDGYSPADDGIIAEARERITKLKN